MNVSITYLLEYGINWLMEEEKDTVDIEEFEPFPLSLIGLGGFFYLIFIKFVQLNFFPSIFSKIYIFQRCIPYINSLLKYPETSLKGLKLLEYNIKNIEENSIVEPIIQETLYNSFAQSLIHFMINCPVFIIRNNTYQLFNQFISLFYEKTRFDLLKSILETCPYSSITGLIIDRFKEEVEKSWPKEKDLPISIFISPKILFIFNYIPKADILNCIETISSTLNFYRFLLIRDKKTNYTNVWKKEEIIRIYKEFIKPLKKNIKQLIQEYLNLSIEKERQQMQQFSHQYGLPGKIFQKFIKKNNKYLLLLELDQNQLQEIKNSQLTTLQLLKDLIERIDELLKGSSPFKGKPNII